MLLSSDTAKEIEAALTRLHARDGAAAAKGKWLIDQLVYHTDVDAVLHTLIAAGISTSELDAIEPKAIFDRSPAALKWKPEGAELGEFVSLVDRSHPAWLRQGVLSVTNCSQAWWKPAGPDPIHRLAPQR